MKAKGRPYRSWDERGALAANAGRRVVAALAATLNDHAIKKWVNKARSPEDRKARQDKIKAFRHLLNETVLLAKKESALPMLVVEAVLRQAGGWPA